MPSIDPVAVTTAVVGDLVTSLPVVIAALRAAGANNVADTVQAILGPTSAVDAAAADADRRADEAFHVPHE